MSDYGSVKDIKRKIREGIGTKVSSAQLQWIQLEIAAFT